MKSKLTSSQGAKGMGRVSTNRVVAHGSWLFDKLSTF